MTKQTTAPDTDLVRSATTEEAWSRALYEALTRFEPTPLYDEVCAQLGRPVLVVA